MRTGAELLDIALVPGTHGGYVKARELLSRGDSLEAIIEACANVAAVDVIRSLGFIGNSHYCADCMHHFHDDAGQHAPECGVLRDLLAEIDE